MVRACAWALAVCVATAAARAQAPPTDPPATPTVADLAARLKALEDAAKNPTPAATPPVAETPPPTPSTGAASPVPDYTEGAFDPFLSPRGFPPPPAGGRFPLKASFGPGFRLETPDERYQFQFHYESQIEGRAWEQSDQVPANSGFFLPRQRFFFNGHITKPVEYELAINRGANGVNLLNAYLNFHVDDKLELRVGRFFTPFSYDQYAVSNYWLLTPERSLFVTNLSPNRQVGAMAWGYLADKRIDYAVGAFNGGRNSFESQTNALDVVAYVNARPFQESALTAVKYLNVGSSVAYGRQSQNPVPATLRVGAGSPDANIPSAATVPFLTFNPGTREEGDRLLGSVHAAYFYKQLSVIGEWQYGYGGYATAARPDSVRVPFGGYYVSAGYFLTGEEVTRRTRVKPLRPLFPTEDGQPRGLGALEASTRVSQLRAGDRVFTDGFADPTLWSNRATTTEVGVNWYLNEYLKVCAFWLHAEYGSPVLYRPGKSQLTSDMFWLRCQLYF